MSVASSEAADWGWIIGIMWQCQHAWLRMVSLTVSCSIAIPVAAIYMRLAFVPALIYSQVMLWLSLDFAASPPPWILIHYGFLFMVGLTLACLPWVTRSFAVRYILWKIVTSPRKANKDIHTCIVLPTVWAGLWNSNHDSNRDDAYVG